MCSTHGNCKKNNNNKHTQIIITIIEVSKYPYKYRSCQIDSTRTLNNSWVSYLSSITFPTVIVLWQTLTALFDSHLHNQWYNVLVRSHLYIFIEKEQNGGIFHSSERSNYNAPTGAKVFILHKMEEGINKIFLHIWNDVSAQLITA